MSALENATFRILDSDGSTAGTGFLVTPRLGITSTRWASSRRGSLRLKFNGQDEIFRAENISDEFHPQVVLLRLEKIPEGITPLTLGVARNSQIGETFSIFGYPRDGSGNGVYNTGTLLDSERFGMKKEWLIVEMNAPSADHRQKTDLSGAPVWDEERELVVGMVHAIDKVTVFAVRSEIIWDLFPNQIPNPNEHKTSAKPPVINPNRDNPRTLPDDYESGTKGIEAPETAAEYMDGDRTSYADDPTAGDEPSVPSLPTMGVQQPSKKAQPEKRVLNVNFASQDDHHVLLLDEPLRPHRRYNLLVDVGLPWDKIPSLLRENAAFPEDHDVSYLSAEDRQKGWFDLEVVFVSQAFTPSLVSGRIRVQVGTLEQSIPYVNGILSEKPGPLQLRLSPDHPHSPGLRAHGRLCLYYGAQVLQSAIIDVGVREKEEFGRTSNRAAIDYVLTPGFGNIGPEIAQRQRRGKDGNTIQTTVKVGLMLNDDLSGTHRLLLKGDDKDDAAPSLPPAWKAYDSSAISEMLEEARRILANPTGTKPNYESDTFIFDKFKDDLLALAKLGAGLYNMLLQGLTPAEGVNPILWRKKFRSALQPGDVIQLARAGSVPSTHIIPWALVYDGPLELDRSDLPLKLCRVVEEQWNNDAKRKPPFTAQENFVCPYEHEHAENTVCPFDFWGYKYTLEQPISALLGKNWDVAPARRILAGTPVKMAVAATEDVPRENRRLQHFQSIHDSVNAEYLPVAPAFERDQVRDSLRAPQLVYILCHGGKDGKITYLSIGPRGTDARYTITPELPGTWGERNYIDVEKWAETRPLVFINGCYTTDLLPDLTLNFVSAFRDLLAGGVIGTEIPVTVEAGYLAAEKFFERLGRGEDVGQAILGMRWDLLNQGSLLGLAYTPYAMADLHLER